MFADKIKEPDDYLNHSERMLVEAGMFEIYPKLGKYYYELCNQFKLKYYESNISVFNKLAGLLEVDAQIQILIEMIETLKTYYEEFELSEEEIIEMIQNDKKCFYRELTGNSNRDDPKWCLIYLSEE